MLEDEGLDPSKPTHITIVGKKGSGKTELGWLFFDSYGYDRVGIDPNGDIKFPPDAIDLERPVPSRWPGHLLDEARERTGNPRQRALTLRYVPDFGAPDYVDELDRVVGLAYNHPRTMLLIDEAHEAAPAGRTPPHMRRALRQGRHRRLSQILITPRPLTVDPLVLSQADWVYIFKLPNPNDRRRVAETIGRDPKDFDAGVAALGEYEHLRFDARRGELVHCEALPRELIAHHTRAAPEESGF